jgi:transposase
LPLKPGRCGTYTHDYERHGTTTLFAALQVVEGRVIGQCYPRHRHQEFLKFLRRLDAEFPTGKALHLILDNYGTHGHARVQRWLQRHPRFVLHFIPTSSSWLNLIERWFAELDQKAVRRGAFHCVRDLQRRITEFLAAWNASVERILEKIVRARQRLEQIKPGGTKPTNRTSTDITAPCAPARRL